MVENEGIPQKKWCPLQKKEKRERETERKRKYYSRKGVLRQKKTSPLPHSAKPSSRFQNVNILKLCVLSRSVVSDSLKPDGLWPARLLWPWRFSRQEYWSGLPCPPPMDFPNPGIQPKSHIAGRFFTSWATRECLKINEINTWPSNKWYCLLRHKLVTPGDIFGPSESVHESISHLKTMWGRKRNPDSSQKTSVDTHWQDPEPFCKRIQKE